jgi:hypothetical protein
LLFRMKQLDAKELASHCPITAHRVAPKHGYFPTDV